MIKLIPFYYILLILSQLFSNFKVAATPTFSLDYTAEPFYTSTSQLDNPYQGLFRICGFTFSETFSEMPKVDYILEKSINDPILLVEFNLMNYANTPLSEEALYQLDYVLTRFSEGKKFMIVRFLYDWDGKVQSTEPSDISSVLTHMDQVAPIVNKHADYVYILQGLFIGHWGEIHGSKFSSYDDITLLLKHWASVTDSSIYLSVRTPSQWRSAANLFDFPDDFPSFKGLNEATVTDDYDTFISRLGLFDDGMMGSETDVGSYGQTPRSEAVSPSYNAPRDEELAFQDKLCRYVPNGGEVVYDTVYNDLDNAITTLATMHVSYLNAYFDENVLNKWRASTYRGKNAFDLSNGFDYIKAHLGYRYEITGSDLIFYYLFTHDAKLRISLSNTGFSSTFRNFDVTITLKGRDNDFICSYPLDCDLKYLGSNENNTYILMLPVRDYDYGTYDIYINTADNVINQNIYMANTNEYTDLGYFLGTLTKSSVK